MRVSVCLYCFRPGGACKDLRSNLKYLNVCLRSTCKCIEFFRFLRKANAFLCSLRPGGACKDLRSNLRYLNVCLRSTQKNNLPLFYLLIMSAYSFQFSAALFEISTKVFSESAKVCRCCSAKK